MDSDSEKIYCSTAIGVDGAVLAVGAKQWRLSIKRLRLGELIWMTTDVPESKYNIVHTIIKFLFLRISSRDRVRQASMQRETGGYARGESKEKTRYIYSRQTHKRHK